MKTSIRLLVPLLAVLLLPASVRAETPIQCPDMAQARQVGNCPSKDELRHTFRRTCGNEERNKQFQGTAMLYCDSFEAYVAEKNTALWEVEAGGRVFDDYVSCAMDAQAVQSADLDRVRVECGPDNCTVHCQYDQDLYMTLRGLDKCRLEDGEHTIGLAVAECGPDGEGCGVRCE